MTKLRRAWILAVPALIVMFTSSLFQIAPASAAGLHVSQGSLGGPKQYHAD